MCCPRMRQRIWLQLGAPMARPRGAQRPGPAHPVPELQQVARSDRPDPGPLSARAQGRGDARVAPPLEKGDEMKMPREG